VVNVNRKVIFIIFVDNVLDNKKLSPPLLFIIYINGDDDGKDPFVSIYSIRKL